MFHRCRNSAVPPAIRLPVSRALDRRRAVARLALLGLLIAAGFAAVTLAGVGPDEARRWMATAGPMGPILFVLVAGALGLALFPGQVVATVAGLLFGALGGTAVALGTALLAAALSLLLARRV